MEILQRLYDSEINVSLTSDWDDGWRWKVGAGQVWLAEGAADTVAEAVHFIKSAALKHFPASAFAQSKP